MNDPLHRADETPVLGSYAPSATETHISLLFGFGDRMFKLKKPVRLSILDWRDRAARERACHREVELNRRLSPDVYLGVIDVWRDGAMVDHLVEMRRMPASRRLAHLLGDGVDVSTELTELAGLVARFHATARRSTAISARATVEAVGARWDELLRVVRAHAGPSTEPGMLDEVVVERIAELSSGYLAGRRALFASRISSGLIVDGHGDLMAEDIFLLEDGPRVLDCIEFSDELRSVDVLDDVCTLAMDLERFGSAALAAHFLGAYAEASGEHHPSSLADHWIAYRAMVRADVACTRADQGAAHAPADLAEAQMLLDVARRHLERARVRLVVVSGLPGTGKSTVANALGASTKWSVVHSDLVRKELFGLAPDCSAVDALGAYAYSPATTTRTYEMMLACAADHLSMGESVVLDATWRDPHWRSRVEAVARAGHAELVVLECVAPDDVTEMRLTRRPDTVGSDATVDVARAMARHAECWPGAVVLDTTKPLDITLTRAMDALD